MPALFPPGQVVSTPNALEQVAHADINKAFLRHLSGDWGDVSQDDTQSNNQALKNGGRLLSEYHSAQGVKFWIITEADRSVTTVLLPSDY